jgi:hypothetical protein
LLDRDPFDRITLDAANDNAVVETVLLELPERRVPDPLPKEGTLEFRRLSEPSIPYAVDWSAVAKVELFEQMLLAEAQRLTADGQFAEGFEYLAFLATHYPKLSGLEAALEAHLWREASATYAAGNRDASWPALRALYLRNPQFPRLVNAVQAVSDDLIAARLKAKDYAAARAVVDMLEKDFAELELANVARWQGQFQADAQQQMDRARRALADARYSEARSAVNYARSILPDVEGGAELWRQIQAAAPEIRVGVMQRGSLAEPGHVPNWAQARLADLVNPRLVAMTDFGAEGGVYSSPWCELKTNDAGLETTIRFSPSALRIGLKPGVLALRLIDDAARNEGREDFAALLAGVRIADGRDVLATWQRPHVRPEAFLQTPLKELTSAEGSPGLWFERLADAADDSTEEGFQRTGPPTAAPGQPRQIVERVFQSDDDLVDALARGDVDVIDRVPPWHIARLQQAADVVVIPYRLPTVHVLIPNFQNPLLEVREFRRAVSYGIDSESIVRDILLAGGQQPGFRTLSGPFPAGVSLNDPTGYAYNGAIAPRPYEPRLASLLAGVARTTVAKRDAELKKVSADGANEGAPQAGADPPPSDDAGESSEKPPAPPPPLVLAHSGDALARLACQTIKLQLDKVGIPVKLAEFDGAAPRADMKYDLLYAELAVWEPVVDARRLLGASGVAGRASGLMALALDELARSQNWNEARAQLNEIHRIAHYDLPVLPLWQTVNHLAARKAVAGIGANPVSLYQNVSAWRKSVD